MQRFLPNAIHLIFPPKIRRRDSLLALSAARIRAIFFVFQCADMPLLITKTNKKRFSPALSTTKKQPSAAGRHVHQVVQGLQAVHASERAQQAGAVREVHQAGDDGAGIRVRVLTLQFPLRSIPLSAAEMVYWLLFSSTICYWLFSLITVNLLVIKPYNYCSFIGYEDLLPLDYWSLSLISGTLLVIKLFSPVAAETRVAAESLWRVFWARDAKRY